MPTLDWSQCPVVESVPGKVTGAWVLKGTRMPVSAIFENLAAGANLDDILQWFDGPRNHSSFQNRAHANRSRPQRGTIQRGRIAECNEHPLLFFS
jgi:hypothetical protein